MIKYFTEKVFSTDMWLRAKCSLKYEKKIAQYYKIKQIWAENYNKSLLTDNDQTVGLLLHTKTRRQTCLKEKK